MDSILKIVIIFILIFTNGFFVAAEFAMVRVRKTRIKTMADDGNVMAKYTEKIVSNLNSYLSASQLGITLASLGLGWIGEPTVSKIISPIITLFHGSDTTISSISFVLSFIIITSFQIVLGELAPKSLAILNAEKLALFSSIPLTIFYKITYPVICVFNFSTNCILKIFGISQMDEHEIAHTDDEIKILVEESYKHGLIDKTELTFVDNIFDFSEKTVKEIMIPRTDMICFDKEDCFNKFIEIALNEQITRYPVCDKSKDNIIGFIHIKDLFKHSIENKDGNIDDIIRNVITIPEYTSISELFKIFKIKKEQLAIVIDEYGGTAGLVTLEDIIEEIVGDIQDEFDKTGEEEIIRLEDGSYVVDGKVLIEEINEMLNINIDEENIDTVGGWAYNKLNRIPQIDSKFIYEDFEFTILQCNKKRIMKIIIKNII